MVGSKGTRALVTSGVPIQRRANWPKIGLESGLKNKHHTEMLQVPDFNLGNGGLQTGIGFVAKDTKVKHNKYIVDF